jgi:hypothetical protein
MHEAQPLVGFSAAGRWLTGAGDVTDTALDEGFALLAGPAEFPRQWPVSARVKRHVCIAMALEDGTEVVHTSWAVHSAVQFISSSSNPGVPVCPCRPAPACNDTLLVVDLTPSAGGQQQLQQQVEVPLHSKYPRPVHTLEQGAKALLSGTWRHCCFSPHDTNAIAGACASIHTQQLAAAGVVPLVYVSMRTPSSLYVRRPELKRCMPTLPAGYATLELPPPWLVCQGTDQPATAWQIQPQGPALVWHVPTGSLAHLPIVATVTAAAVAASCVWLVRSLWTAGARLGVLTAPESDRFATKMD